VSRLARARWDRLDWASPISPSAFVMPEAHYVDVAGLGLSERQRVGLNRLFACFTCELFVHFEAYVIEYLGRPGRPVPALAPTLVERMVAEERVHSEMFCRLLHKLRPDLYPAGGGLRFFRWRGGDEAAVRLAPVGTFFLLAWLFEEITLFVPRALDESPGQCAPLVAAVMRLHAKEERPHVAIDARVMAHLAGRRPRLRAGVETALALPLLAYVDGKVRRAWRRLVALAGAELGLSAGQRAALRERRPSQSDRWGTQSFVERMAAVDLAGAGLLRWALRRGVAPS
jgi:para-aminobenzoate N-oxygenase AurF